MIQGYPSLNMFLYYALLISGAFILKTEAVEDQQQDCSISYSTGTLITKTDITLKGHQRKILPFESFPQCSLRCVREDWCISINFEAIENKGICELNDYGVQSDFDVSENKNEFEVRKGFVYSQLRPFQFGCHNNPCSNGGTCRIDCKDSQKTQCICPKGFLGDRCNEIDECASNPCQNGGTCDDKDNGYTCTCAAGFNGTHCELDIDECLSDPCSNNGTCTDKVNGYSCVCTEGFHGENCQFGPCDAMPCKNGATCSISGFSFSCTCTPGFIGVTCDVVDSVECSTYTNITDPTRNVNYKTVNRSCDQVSTISFSGWYRLTEGAGVAMPTACVPEYRCGTDATGWLKDPHPTIQEGIVIRKVCFGFSDNCCGWPYDIRVRNCAAYFIYEFVNLRHCYLRYCGKS